jgi:RES domain-containing protein
MAPAALWRISEFVQLDGVGGLIEPGRWHSMGRPIIYAADSSALAMLEVLVHLETDMILPRFQLLRIEGAADLDFDVWDKPLKAGGEVATRAWGDNWLKNDRTALARVPSIIAPGGFNWLINPLHHDINRITVAAKGRYPWDKRLFTKTA